MERHLRSRRLRLSLTVEAFSDSLASSTLAWCREAPSDSEQASLASEIPRLVRVLTSGENGDETFTPVKSLRVGIISSDLGTGPSGACGGTGFGDDGVLITTGNPADPGCSAVELCHFE